MPINYAKSVDVVYILFTTVIFTENTATLAWLLAP